MWPLTSFLSAKGLHVPFLHIFCPGNAVMWECCICSNMNQTKKRKHLQLTIAYFVEVKCISNLVFWELLCKCILFRSLAENGFQITFSSWFIICCFKRMGTFIYVCLIFVLNKFSVVYIYKERNKVWAILGKKYYCCYCNARLK